MLDKTSKVALVLPSNQLLDVFQGALVRKNMNLVTQFRYVEEAFEVTSRQQYDFLVVGLSMPDNPGITLMQRLKALGNYGCEPFMFVGDQVDDATMALIVEFDVDYVLTPPLDKRHIDAKLAYVIEQENNISPTLQVYRDARSAFASGIYEMARDLAETLLDDPQLAEKAHIVLGDVALKEGKLEAAEDAFQAALQLNHQSIGTIHRLARVHMERREYGVAKQLLDKIVEQNPLHLQILAKAGVTNFELGYKELAKSQMHRLESLDRTNKAAGEVLTRAAIDEGKYEGVAKRLTKSHNESEIISMLNGAGVKLSKEGDFDGAIQIYLECLEVVRRKDFIGKIYYNLAVAYRKKRNPAKARSYCQQALEAYPDLEKALQMLKDLEMKESA